VQVAARTVRSADVINTTLSTVTMALKMVLMEVFTTQRNYVDYKPKSPCTIYSSILCLDWNVVCFQNITVILRLASRDGPKFGRAECSARQHVTIRPKFA